MIETTTSNSINVNPEGLASPDLGGREHGREFR